MLYTTPPVPSASSDLYGIDRLLTEPEREVRERVRTFCDKEVVPVINDYWNREEFPFELVPRLAELGIAGGRIDGYGCPGHSAVAEGLVQAELARADGSISTFHAVQSGLAMNSIATLGDDEQKQRWLPSMARLEHLGAFALTEPAHGSDIVRMETRARRDGDSYVLQGEKRWIGNGSIADYVVVWARDDDGDIGGFVVDRSQGEVDGYDAERIQGKIANRALWQAHIRLDSVRVPADHRLAQSRTFADTARVLTTSRQAVAWEALGHATAAYDYALAYATEREQFGRPIASFQLIQDKLSRMLGELIAMQTMLLQLGRLADDECASLGIASVAKLHCTSAARRLAADARDILGGNGILIGHHVGRHFADMEAVYTYEGTANVQSLIVGRDVTGFAAFA